jgi:5'-nucleotidase
LAPTARYEGREVLPDPHVERAMMPQLERVRALQAMPLGVYLDTPMPRTPLLESALGNLFADALRASVDGADVAINNNGAGGLRADLPAGPLTFGRLYELFPFDNRVARVRVSAEDLTRALETTLRRPRRSGLGVSGVSVRVSCGNDGLRVELMRQPGRPLEPNEELTVVVMDSMVTSANFAVLKVSAPSTVFDDAPTLREAVEDWLVARGGRLSADQFVDPGRRRWEAPDAFPDSCLR